MRVFCLDSMHSTTRVVTSKSLRFNHGPDIGFIRQPSLPPNPERKGEGGLRTKGYLKKNNHHQGSDAVKVAGVKVKPLITVITVVFNGAATIENTIESIISQSYDRVEYIVIDGGSTDGTIDIIRKFEHSIDYWVSEPDTGIYDAWNKGIVLSSGDWISFLGCDDIYLHGAIDAYARIISNFRDRPVDYISSKVNLTTGTKVVRTVGQRWNWKYFKKYMNVAHPGSMHSIRLFKEHGLYDTTYKICGDYELLLRARKELKVEFISSATVGMCIGGVSDNTSALCEAERAKVITGGRIRALCYIEKLTAVAQLRLRKWLWY